VLLLVCAGMLAMLFTADILNEQRPFAPRVFWALFDSLVHGLVALLVTLPILRVSGNTKQTVALFCLVFLSATLIDLDHFVAARALDFGKALSLDVRPPTHSLTFAGLAGVIAFFVSRSSGVAWAIFAALSSHALRDASVGSTTILWPLPLLSIPRWTYYVGEVVLLLLTYILVSRSWIALQGPGAK
jgi:hypothetical protein